MLAPVDRCITLGFVITLYPPLGCLLFFVALWLVPGSRRKEYLCLFWMSGIVPYFIVLPFLLVTGQAGRHRFLGLALLRQFFAFWREDPYPGIEDVGPGFTIEQWWAMITILLTATVLVAAYYGYLMGKRHSVEAPPN